MRKLIARALTMTLTTALLASTTSIAQDPGDAKKPDATALTNAPTIPEMIVDPDGTLHFGPRTVPPPALYSDEARAAYIKCALRFLTCINLRRTGRVAHGSMPGESHCRSGALIHRTHTINIEEVRVIAGSRCPKRIS